MTWARLDDGFWRNPKIQALTPQQVVFYVAAISYSADQLTDGKLSTAAVKTIVAAHRLRHQRGLLRGLQQAGLLSTDGDTYRIHDYLDYNPAKADVQAKRAADAERKRRQRHGGTHSGSHGGSHAAPDPAPDVLKKSTYRDSPTATANQARVWWRNIGQHVPEPHQAEYLARDLEVDPQLADQLLNEARAENPS